MTGQEATAVWEDSYPIPASVDSIAAFARKSMAKRFGQLYVSLLALDGVSFFPKHPKFRDFARKERPTLNVSGTDSYQINGEIASSTAYKFSDGRKPASGDAPPDPSDRIATVWCYAPKTINQKELTSKCRTLRNGVAIAPAKVGPPVAIISGMAPQEKK